MKKIFICKKKYQKKYGGADWDRTSDPHNAIVVLYQLSYDPTRKKGNCIDSLHAVKRFFKI